MTDALKPGFTYLCCEGRARARGIKSLVKDGEWFTEDILIQGKTVTIKYDPRSIVHYKNVRIRPLS